MRIPVFVSCPTTLNRQQEKSRRIVLSLLDNVGVEPRALGRSDYPTTYPLREIFIIAKHCSGGVILGFEQIRLSSGFRKPGTKEEKAITDLAIPTPWNHLEAGILFGMKLPLLIFKEPSIEGGVFDPGGTDVFVHKMPASTTALRDAGLREVFMKWHGKVLEHYQAC